ncbi:hypothetical protein [uncultured Polaribacter sp.]|uniref:hypothetical protein n=1 Tax=uncultured Polaribacter sp. TaxID=174711 RepID=UPI0026275FDA|nr:hypothetical protein [uncultured Polaribacter sp.]
MEEFISFEEENNLFAWNIDSIPIWELVRTIIFTELSSKLVNKFVVKRNEKKGLRIKLFFNILYNSIFHNPFFSFKRKDILILNHPRRKFNQGFFEDIYIDNLLPSLNNNYLLLEGFVSHNQAHLKPIKRNNFFYLDLIQFTSNIISKKQGTKLSLGDLEKIKTLEWKISNIWNVHTNTLQNEIPILLKKWKITKFFIVKLLIKFKPKVVVTVVSYSFINQVFNYVSKQKKIPIVELQHGTVGKYHINYNYKNYKNLTLKTFPDFFLAWGENWVKNSRLPLLDKNIISTGYPYIDNFRNEIKIKRNLNQLVFISQIREDIAYFTQEVAKILPDFKIIFKAHPAEYSFANRKYKSILISKNIEIVTNDEKNLYTLFKESYAIFGVHSTALIEALAFCPKIGIIKLSGWEYFENIEESNKIVFIDNKKDAIDYILKNDYKDSKILNNNYFENNSRENIINFLNKFL